MGRALLAATTLWCAVLLVNAFPVYWYDSLDQYLGVALPGVDQCDAHPTTAVEDPDLPFVSPHGSPSLDRSVQPWSTSCTYKQTSGT